jgi:hypothetical protein
MKRGILLPYRHANKNGLVWFGLMGTAGKPSGRFGLVGNDPFSRDQDWNRMRHPSTIQAC